jgi:hydroxymethylbilane synthase
MRTLVLGTRGSKLALWQARHVAAKLREARPGLEIREEIIRTEGDVSTKQFGADSNKGVFVKEIEDALLERRIDLAVHSLKDVPTEMTDALGLPAVLERHDPRDGLLSENGWSFEDLPRGTVVATGSFRRRCQMLSLRPDLEVVPVRGNVDTRIRKLREGRFGALVLALAGVQRLGLDEVAIRPIPAEVCLPAVGQGAVAVQVRTEDREAWDAVATLDHPETHDRVRAERAFLRRLGGGCLAPATGFADLDGDRIRIRAAVGDPDGSTVLRDEESGPRVEAVAVGEALAVRLLDAGAGELLAAARQSAAENG